MKKLLLAALFASSVTYGAPVQANAVPPGCLLDPSCDYRGNCAFSSTNDTTPGGQFGGQDVWNGEIHLAFVAPSPTSTITGSCELQVNGVSQGTVLGPVTGTGAVVAAGQIQYTAAITDVVSLCNHVTVDGTPHVDCRDVTTTQVVPQPIIDALDLVLQTIADATASTDPLVCNVVAPLAPSVNSVGGTTLHEDPDDCDIWLLGERQIDFVPYGD